MSPPKRSRDTAGELRPEIAMTDAELVASVEAFTEDGPDDTLEPARPEPDPEKVAAAVARLATYRDEPEPVDSDDRDDFATEAERDAGTFLEPEPEPEPEPVPPAPSRPNGKPGAGELAAVRQAAEAYQDAREELYEAMRRARAVDPPPSLREVAAAAGLSHAHVHREVG